MCQIELSKIRSRRSRNHDKLKTSGFDFYMNENFPGAPYIAIDRGDPNPQEALKVDPSHVRYAIKTSRSLLRTRTVAVGHFLPLGLEESRLRSVIAEWYGATATDLLKIQPPPWFPTALIVATTFSCKDLAQGGCCRFQPINMPTHIQNRVAMILSDAVRCRELDSYYGLLRPGWCRSLPFNRVDSPL